MNFIDQQTIDVVEARRKKRRLIDLLMLLSILVAWIIFFALFGINDNLNNILMLIAFASIPGCIFVRIRNKKSFYKDFKENLVALNINRHYPGFRYLSLNKIAASEIKNSNLFDTFNSYSGDDYIDGTFQNIPLSFSEIKIAYVKKRTGSNSGNSRREIFQGLFLTAELPFTVSAPILIRPRMKLDKIPKILRIFIPEDLINPPNEVVTSFENLNKEFTVTSQNPTEALQFVNSKIVDEIFWIGEAVRKFNAQLPSGIFYLSAAAAFPIYISIVGDRLSIGAGGIRLFDPKYKKNLSQDATQLDSSLSIIKNIIEFTTYLARRSEN